MAPQTMAMAKMMMVAVTMTKIVQGSASPMMLATVRG